MICTDFRHKVELCSSTAYHGRDGYLSVSDGTATPLNQHYSAAVRELGLQHVDCNGESQIGKIMIYQYLVYSKRNFNSKN